MSEDTEWFEGQADKKRGLILPLIFWLIAIGILIVSAGMLSGCSMTSLLAAPEVEKPICFIQLLGQTEEGLTVVVQHCVTKEEFQAAQK